MSLKTEDAVFAADTRLLETAERRERFVRGAVDHHPTRLKPVRNVPGSLFA
jgi:hypothetical protein